MPSSPLLASAPAAADPRSLTARVETSETLARVAHLLGEVAVVQARSAREVRATWRGPHRSRFDAERARRDAELAGLAETCRLLAGR